MLPVQRRAADAVVRQSGHVCLSCRLKTQYQQRRQLSQQSPADPDDEELDPFRENLHAHRRHEVSDRPPPPVHKFAVPTSSRALSLRPQKANYKRTINTEKTTGQPAKSSRAVFIRKHPASGDIIDDRWYREHRRSAAKGFKLHKYVSPHDVVRRLFERRTSDERQSVQFRGIPGIRRHTHPGVRMVNIPEELEAEAEAVDKEFNAVLESHLGGADAIRSFFNLESKVAVEKYIAQLERTLERALRKQGVKPNNLFSSQDHSQLKKVKLDRTMSWCLSTLQDLYKVRRDMHGEPEAEGPSYVAQRTSNQSKRQIDGATIVEDPSREHIQSDAPGIRFHDASQSPGIRNNRPFPAPSGDVDRRFTNCVGRASSQRVSSRKPEPPPSSPASASAFAWQRPSWALSSGQQTRAFSSTNYQYRATAAEASYLSPYAQPPPDMSSDPNYSAPRRKVENPSGIRAQLRRWQEAHGKDETHATPSIDVGASDGVTGNTLTRLTENDNRHRDAEDDTQDQQEAMMEFTNAKVDELSGNQLDPRFLKQGDLCEIEFPKTERESILAIFIQRFQNFAQFYTIQGRWMHMEEKKIQYAVPSVIRPEMLAPLIEHLPTEDQYANREALEQLAYVEDLSVPRRVSKPVIDRLAQFQRESDEIYRRHASSLDSAHDLLAHDTDLRYGSLLSTAMVLLRTTADKVSPAALFTVRKSLMRAGYAFNIDRRSHRATGYLQIRSRDQVRMVEYVRNWIREWQDDLALTSGKTEGAKKRHKSNRGAQIVQDFIEKSRSIVLKSRENRDPTPFGNVGPSKIKRTISEDQSAVEMTAEEMFTKEESELVRFLEAWTCSNMFLGLPRLESLPPLILQATGLYKEAGYGFMPSTGFVFLQEIGTILPYENRIRFDQHLLLPSSQHSRPLQKLMTKILAMRQNPDFNDSMSDLRRDWGNMPVFCVDAAGAHEIDDGISLERAGLDQATGKFIYWVHIHIANPTAFFDRDHPLAKMARHMGESIYMPERAYTMLAPWTTSGHFSLRRNRPCLTFSVKMDEDGTKLGHKIQPGTIHNVQRLTPTEVDQLLDEHQAPLAPSEELVMTVGGDPPPSKASASNLAHVTTQMKDDLRILSKIAATRFAFRSAAGGVSFDMSSPEVNVWQNYNTGLAWDHPFRKGGRIVEGDPVIQFRTKPFQNWFAAKSRPGENMVKEMMLLTCETAASWCAERQIPTLYRGTKIRPDRIGSEKFMREVLAPATEKNDGEYPFTLGLQYITTLGTTSLSTEPLAHRTLGLDYYTKATSPLRRYGDMILHWQIEAALREEARTGKSLVTTQPRTTSASQAFLPFPTQALKTIITGLQPRESIITRAKGYSERHWQVLLFFRAFHFGEAALPADTFRAIIYGKVNDPGAQLVQVMVEELNINATMTPPRERTVGAGKITPAAQGGLLGWATAGDVWEVKIEYVHVYRREISVRALRLVSREEWADMI